MIHTDLPLVVGVFGPTACRKSEYALEMAQKLNAEIINCDSVQVYSKVQIGANKPSKQELKVVPHHLFSIVDPPDVYTAGRFHADFHRVIDERARAGVKVFFLVGGSHFYARAALKGLYPVEASRPERREALTKEWLLDGGKDLFQELTERDPAYAQKIGPADQKRVVRALEILRFSEYKTLGELEDKLKSLPKNFRSIELAFYRDREDLRARILERSKEMLRQGLIAEVESLREQGLANWAPMKSVGYAEVNAYIDGQLAEDKLAIEIAQKTARLAKRQMTWLRSEEQVQWIHADRHWQKALELLP